MAKLEKLSDEMQDKMEQKNNDVFLRFNEETAFKVTKDGTLFIDMLAQRCEPVDHVDVELTLERKDNNTQNTDSDEEIQGF